MLARDRVVRLDRADDTARSIPGEIERCIRGADAEFPWSGACGKSFAERVSALDGTHSRCWGNRHNIGDVRRSVTMALIAAPM